MKVYFDEDGWKTWIDTMEIINNVFSVSKSDLKMLFNFFFLGAGFSHFAGPGRRSGLVLASRAWILAITIKSPRYKIPIKNIYFYIITSLLNNNTNTKNQFLQ